MNRSTDHGADVPDVRHIFGVEGQMSGLAALDVSV